MNIDVIIVSIQIVRIFRFEFLNRVSIEKYWIWIIVVPIDRRFRIRDWIRIICVWFIRIFRIDNRIRNIDVIIVTMFWIEDWIRNLDVRIARALTLTIGTDMWMSRLSGFWCRQVTN